MMVYGWITSGKVVHQRFSASAFRPNCLNNFPVTFFIPVGILSKEEHCESKMSGRRIQHGDHHLLSMKALYLASNTLYYTASLINNEQYYFHEMKA